MSFEAADRFASCLAFVLFAFEVGACGLGDEFRPVAATCAFAALRISETLALKWGDISFDDAMLYVREGKTSASAQSVPMIPELVAELQAQRRRALLASFTRVASDAFVFVTATGKPQHRKNALRAVHAAGDAAGLNPEGAEKVGLHDLRHSCAGLLLAAGVPMPKVAAILRHADARVTATTYAGLVESDRAQLGTDLASAWDPVATSVAT